MKQLYFLFIIIFSGAFNVLLSQGIWVQKNDFPGTARQSAASFTIGEVGYVGTGNDGSFTKDFWAYDQKTNSWTQKADFGGSARESGIGFSLLDKGYIGTGTDVSGVTRDIWEYDPSTNSWAQKNDFGGVARENAVVATLNGKAYVSVGRDGSTFPADMWEYDPIGDSWTEKEALPSDGRTGAFAFGINNKIYIGNGYNYDGGSFATNDVWEFDPSTNSWAEKALFTEGTLTGSNAYFTLDNKGYFLTSSSSGGFFEYNPSNDTWNELASFGTAGNNNRTNPTSFVIGNIGYVATGYYSESIFVGNDTKDMWLFSLNGALPAAPYNFKAELISLTEIKLTWEIEDAEDNIGYVLSRQANSSGYNVIDTLYGDVTTYSDTDSELTDGKYYDYKILAINSIGTSGETSTQISIPFHIEKPSNLFATPKNIKQIELTWNQRAIDEEGFRIERSIDDNTNFIEIAVVEANVTTYEDKNVIAGTEYFYRVRTTDFIDDSDYSNEASTIPGDLGVWTRKSDYKGIADWYIASFAINGKGYMGLGNSIANDFWEYDPVNDTWTQIADFPGGSRRLATAFTIADKGYVGLGRGEEDYEFKKDLWRYDPVNNYWSQRANFGGTARYGAASFVIDDKAYVGLGDEYGIADFWEYNATADSWMPIADFPGIGLNNWGNSGLTIGGKGYVFDLNKTGNVWEYDPVNDNWTQKASMARGGNQFAISFVIDGYGYIGMGGGTKDFWQFDPINNSWVQKAAFGGGIRESGTGFAINGKGYAGTGHKTIYNSNGSGYPVRKKDFWEYNPNAPNSPTELTGTGIFDTQVIDLNWSDNSNIETGYQVERSVGNSDNYVVIQVKGASQNSHFDLDVTSGIDYYYRVRAINSTENSNYSNEIIVSLPGVPLAPSNASLTILTFSQLRLNWIDNTNNEAGYIIERSEEGAEYAKIDTISADIESFTDINLNSNTTYSYRVMAYNNYGNSEYSNEISETTPSNIPDAPTGLQAWVLSTTEIQLIWQDISDIEDGYIIERSEEGAEYAKIDTVGANVESFTNINLKPNTTYSYRIMAFNIYENSEYSNEVSETTLSNIPEAPISLQAWPLSTTEIQLIWQDITDIEDGYIIERSEEGAEYAKIDTVGANVENFVDLNLKSNTTYFYRIMAYNNYGNSDYSNEISETTPIYIPETPTGLQATALSQSEIQLTWFDQSSDEDGFIIERSVGSSTTFEIIDTVGADVISHTNKNLESSTTYYFRIVSFSKDGNSSYSNQSSASTWAKIPDAPSNLDAKINANRTVGIDLAWSDNSSTEEGFILEKSVGSQNDFVQLTELPENSTTYYDEAGGEFDFYRIKAYNISGSSAYSNVSGVEIIAGVGDELSKEFKIYGSRNQIIVEAKSEVIGTNKFKVVNMKGSIIYQGVINNRITQIENINAGIYIVIILGENENSVERVLVEN